jgi:hypothetical protein
LTVARRRAKKSLAAIALNFMRDAIAWLRRVSWCLGEYDE